MSVQYTAKVDRNFENPGPDHEVSVQLEFTYDTFDITFFEPGLDSEEYVRRALEVHRLESDVCEWNPDKNELATDGDEPHGFAEFVVGAKGQFRLCASCAALKQFKKYRKRNPVKYDCIHLQVIGGSGTTKISPIPQQWLTTWSLPPGWENHITIQVAGGDILQGNADAVALSYQHENRWVFSVPTEWLSLRWGKGSAAAFTTLTIEEFRTVLIDMIAQTEFDAVFGSPLTEDERATLEICLAKQYGGEAA